MGIFIAIFVLSFLIFFHELGHFTAARFFGVQVDVFSIGFGKKIFQKKIGKTLWALSIIPLGGYVKMKGQDDSDPTAVNYDNDSYTAKKPWQRIIILLAGPFANFFMAFLIYFGISQLSPYPSPLFNYSHYIPAKVGSFSPISPAQKAGMEINDTILSINQTPIQYWDEISTAIQHNKGMLEIELQRNDTLISLSLMPIRKTIKNRFGEEIERQFIGIAPYAQGTIPPRIEFSLIEGIKFAWSETLYASTMIFKSIQKLITGSVPANQLGGVVSIVDVTAKASASGMVMLLLFTALISVNLGVLNLLPIPALDGGHIMFNLYEIIRRKPPSEAVMYRLTIMGWAILLSLMLLGLYNDINRLLG